MMLRTLLVTAGGLGFMRPASGTWGSMPTAGLAWIMLLTGATDLLYNAALIAVCLITSIICIALGPWAEIRFTKKDPSEVVADETAGQAIPLLFLTHTCPTLTSADFTQRLIPATLAVGAGFVLFRIMDIIKPPPANGLQRLPGGWGVLIDDLLAGLYAGIVLHLGLWLIC